MDSSIRIPVIGKKIGWDAIIGLVPGIGDLAGAVISGYIVVSAAKLGVPRGAQARMVANIGLETLIGAVPLVGDLFDMAFRANLRNVALIERHLEPNAAQREPRSNQRGAKTLLVLLGVTSLLALGAIASRLLASSL